ncbi:MAG: hypothetical protein EBZ07_08275 [Verrucomicrobia bacterium]|nr:hypothetical protein [Verrucomicrobiota bacterium]
MPHDFLIIGVMRVSHYQHAGIEIQPLLPKGPYTLKEPVRSFDRGEIPDKQNPGLSILGLSSGRKIKNPADRVGNKAAPLIHS